MPETRPAQGYTLDQLHQAELDLLSEMSEALFSTKHHCSRDEMYHRLYPEVFQQGSRRDLTNA